MTDDTEGIKMMSVPQGAKLACARVIEANRNIIDILANIIDSDLIGRSVALAELQTHAPVCQSRVALIECFCSGQIQMSFP